MKTAEQREQERQQLAARVYNEDTPEQQQFADYSKYDGMTALQLVRELDRVQQLKDAADEAAKALGKEFDHLRITRVPAAFDEEGITNLTVDGVGRCSLTADLHASIASGRKDDAFTWLRDTGRDALIVETVNSGTLKAALKKAMLSGETLPEDVFNVTPYTRASITRRGL